MRDDAGRRAWLLVARREFVERGRDRSFRISTAVTMTFLIGFIVVTSLGSGSRTYDVGVVGSSSPGSIRLAEAAAHSMGFTIRTKSYPTVDAATVGVRDGAVDAALAGGAIVVKSAGSEDLIAALQVSSQRDEVRSALAREGLSPEQISSALDRPAPPVRALEAPRPQRGQAAVVAFVGVLALYGQLFAYGYWVASGVVEEKASRIIEVLLATVRPSQLLRGKILGIG